MNKATLFHNYVGAAGLLANACRLSTLLHACTCAAIYQRQISLNLYGFLVQ